MNTPVVSVVATCWSPDCEEPIAQPDGRITYWCERHDTERRERIKAAMARLENDSYGMPRKRPGTHEIEIKSAHNYIDNRADWWWACSCGKTSGAASRTQGLARAAGDRHLRAVEKAEARA